MQAVHADHHTDTTFSNKVMAQRNTIAECWPHAAFCHVKCFLRKFALGGFTNPEGRKSLPFKVGSKRPLIDLALTGALDSSFLCSDGVPPEFNQSAA